VSQAVFIYDSDCGVCTAIARWIDRTAESQITCQPCGGIAAKSLGVNVRDCKQAAILVMTATNECYAGHRALGTALVVMGGPYSRFGRLINHRAAEFVASRAYRWFAVHRHRLPIGRTRCKVPPV
jgi:predicted DCC family thiol-disulfide oxidoreductase YuxK